ncbi:hypothetical protein DFH27DRAFT_548046 [Peziza echinospora]|nr:hypothetical protein DFH27DRAFT_548046 [Peziza echinospora]
MFGSLIFILSAIFLAGSFFGMTFGLPTTIVASPSGASKTLEPRSLDFANVNSDHIDPATAAELNGAVEGVEETKSNLLHPMIECEQDDFILDSNGDIYSDCFENLGGSPAAASNSPDSAGGMVIDMLKDFDRPAEFSSGCDIETALESVDGTSRCSEQGGCGCVKPNGGSEGGAGVCPKCACGQDDIDCDPDFERLMKEDKDRGEFYNRVASPEAFFVDEEEEQGFGMGGVHKGGKRSAVPEPVDLSQITIDLAKDLYMTLNYPHPNPHSSSSPDSAAEDDDDLGLDPISIHDQRHTNTPAPPENQNERISTNGIRGSGGGVVVGLRGNEDVVGGPGGGAVGGLQPGRIARPNTPALRQMSVNRD